jgi:RNA polymerase sigma factor (sigma-70 family)
LITQHDRLLALLNSDGARLHARLHALLIRLTLRRDVAEELLQELFLRLSQSMAFASVEYPFAYARRVAINLAMERRRSQRSNLTRTAIEPDEALVQPTSPPLQQMVRAEELAQILDELAEIAELSRECFVLRFIEDESYEAIARKIGKTVHQARGLCHSAVKQLRERLNMKATE